MEETANNVVQMVDEINVFQALIDILEFLPKLSWDAKATNTMSYFVFKFLEFLGFLLHGPNKPLTKITLLMVDLKENLVSIMGLPLQKLQVTVYQLNSLIKLTLEVIEYTSYLALLSHIEYRKEDLLLMFMHWVILSVVACYIQITLIIHNG